MLYPDIDGMISRIASKGRKVVTIVDPHVLIDKGYFLYKECIEKDNFFVKDYKNENFIGKCWPGDCHWLDFINEDVRKYFASLYSYEKYLHST